MVTIIIVLSFMLVVSLLTNYGLIYMLKKKERKDKDE